MLDDVEYWTWQCCELWIWILKSGFERHSYQKAENRLVHLFSVSGVSSALIYFLIPIFQLTSYTKKPFCFQSKQIQIQQKGFLKYAFHAVCIQFFFQCLCSCARIWLQNLWIVS